LHDDGRTHVTINNGIHEPKEMGIVAKAIFDGCTEITIGHDSYQRTYIITKGAECQLRYISVFCI